MPKLDDDDPDDDDNPDVDEDLEDDEVFMRGIWKICFPRTDPQFCQTVT